LHGGVATCAYGHEFSGRILPLFHLRRAVRGCSSALRGAAVTYFATPALLRMGARCRCLFPVDDRPHLSQLSAEPTLTFLGVVNFHLSRILSDDQIAVWWAFSLELLD